jgi:hypothetical protein
VGEIGGTTGWNAVIVGPFRRAFVIPVSPECRGGVLAPAYCLLFCQFIMPERGGLEGWTGVAEEASDISLERMPAAVQPHYAGVMRLVV